MKVETAYHQITSNSTTKPEYACRGKCKSVWWQDEPVFAGKTALEVLKCPKCGGAISSAKEERDYRVIDKDAVADSRGATIIQTLHEVKPEYEDFAKREWC